MGGSYVFRQFWNSSQAVIPSSCRMFVYSEETSRVSKIQPDGSQGNLCNLLMKSVVSRIYDGSWITLGSRKKSAKGEIFSVGHRLKLRWVCLGYHAYGSSAINKIWLPVDTEGLGNSLLFYLSAFFDTWSPHTVLRPSYIEMLGLRKASGRIRTRLIAQHDYRRSFICRFYYNIGALPKVI